MKGNATCRTSNDKYRDGWDRVFGKVKLFPLYHYGDNACGGIAIYTKSSVARGDRVWVSNVVLVDGSTPVPGDIMRCGSCSHIFDREWTGEYDKEKVGALEVSRAFNNDNK